MNYFLLFFLEIEGELLFFGGAFLLGLADEEWAQALWVEFVDADDGLGELRGEFVAGDEENCEVSSLQVMKYFAFFITTPIFFRS